LKINIPQKINNMSLSVLRFNCPENEPPSGNNEGEMRLYINDINEPALRICIKRYNEYEWCAMDDISAANWMKYRDDIGRVYAQSSFSTKSNTHSPIDNNMIISILSILTTSQRKDWFKKHPEYTKNVCTGCGKFCNEMKKCVHLDCTGMCKVCFDKTNELEFEVCGCCEQKQELQCPICQDTHPVNNMIKSETCCHHVCYKCFGMSIKTSRPLANCPMCRSVFCENLVENNSGMESDSDYSDDDMPPLEDNIVPLAAPLESFASEEYWVQTAIMEWSHDNLDGVNV
jgi:hypothetical protein